MMDKLMPVSDEFEKEIRTALAVPDVEAEFVAALRSQIQSAGAQNAAPQPARPARRSRWFQQPAWAFSLGVAALVVIIILAAGPQRVLAAVRSLLGYIPGIGYVQPGATLRALEAPVTLERDGITVKVQQGIADSEKVILRYQVDGIQPRHRTTSEADAGCIQFAYLRLPNGDQRALGAGGSQGWPGGYQSRDEFEAVPASVNEFTLVIPCLMDTQPGAAPEDWEFNLRLVPADVEVLPVIELTPVQPTQAPETPAETTALPTQSSSTPTQGIFLSVEKMIELEDGYLFHGTFNWVDTEFSMVNINLFDLKLSDANGVQIPVEPAESETGNVVDLSQRKQDWAIQIQGKGYASPLTLSLQSVQPMQADLRIPFELDLGPNPQLGQVWEINQSLDVQGSSLTLVRGELSMERENEYALNFKFQADPKEIVDLTALAVNNPNIVGASSGTDGRGDITQGFAYSTLPSGLQRFEINAVSRPLEGPWTVSFDLPGEAGAAPPVQPSSCLDAERLQQLRSAPAGDVPVGGHLLVEGPVEEGAHFPTLAVVNLDSFDKTVIGPGGWATISPDGSQVIYTREDGVHRFDVLTRQDELLNWGQGFDYNPLWSPDGQWIAFVRSGDGIYITRPDGSDLRKIENTGPSTFLGGWMPDSQRLMITLLDGDGQHMSILEIKTGTTSPLFTVEMSKNASAMPAPSGLSLLYRERVFGMPAYGVFVANLDGSNPQRIAGFDGSNVLGLAWSPDAQWIAVSIAGSDGPGEVDEQYLVNPTHCEAVRVEGIEGNIKGWSN